LSDFIVCSCRSSYLAVRAGRRPAIGGSEGLPQRAGVDDTGNAQRAPEGPAALREREAGRIEMEIGSPTRPDARRVGLDPD
jgi:hypothetical protein